MHSDDGTSVGVPLRRSGDVAPGNLVVLTGSRPRPASAPSPRWVAHAGLGRHRPGGVPTPETLHHAVRLGVARIELDVCISADDVLLVRHDARLADGTPVRTRSARSLCADDPSLLRLDHAADIIDGRVPLLLDLKDRAAAAAVATWADLPRHEMPPAVTTEDLVALDEIRALSPRVPLWPAFPDLGRDRPGWMRWVRVAASRHGSPRGVAQLVGEVASGVGDLRRRRDAGMARLGGLPWRRHLPGDLPELLDRLSPAALCVHHWLATEELREATRALGLQLVVWTVNDGAIARRVAAISPDFITTDDPAGMRAALHDPD